MKLLLYTFLCVVMCVTNHSYAQTTNFDFELTSPGAYTSSTAVSGWTVSSQTNTNTCNSTTIWTPGSAEFSIVATPVLSFSSIGNILSSPFGGSRVAQLNSSVANASSTKLTRTFSVTPSTVLLQFAFASLLQSAHTCCDQTSFTIQVVGSQSSTISCLSYGRIPPGTSCVAGTTGYSMTLTGSVYDCWNNWTTQNFDLTPYIGNLVTLEVIVNDCPLGDHYGTLFFDAKLGNSSLLIGSGLPTYSTSAPSGVSFCPGSAVATIQGPLGYASYSWTAPSSSYISPSQATLSGISIFNPIPGLTYTLHMTTMSGCTYVMPYTLHYTTAGIAAIGSSSTCAAGAGGSSTVVATGSSNGYNYSWVNATNSVVGTTSVVNNLSPGIYTVHVTAGSCGSAVATTTVGIEPTPLTSIVKPFCNGQIYLSYPGGSNYQWYYNQTAITASLGGTAPGYTTTTPLNQVVYVVSYDNPYGCRDSLSISLISSIPGSVSISSNPLSCPGSTNGIAVVSLTPVAGAPNGANSFSVFSVGSLSPAYTASISPTGATTFTATNLTAGASYSVKAFDGSCNYTTTFSVTPYVFDYTITPSNSPTICSGNTMVAGISFTSHPSLSQYTYSWTPATFLFVTANQFAIATPTTQPGSITTIIYTVVVTPSIVNCPLTKTLALVIANPLTPTITALPALCNNVANYTVSALPAGGVFFDYNGAISSSGVLSPTLAALGLNTFTYANAIGTCVAKSSASYSVNSAPVISIAGNTMICEGQSTTLLASGANSYSWSNSVHSPFITQSPSITTSYTVTGANLVTNCSAHQSITVLVLPKPVLTVAADTLLCAGENTTLMATGADIFSWSTGISGNAIVISPLTTSSYTLRGTNTAGSCSSQKIIIVTVSPCTELENQSQATTNLKVYPNPFHNFIFVETNYNVVLSLYNELGNLLFSQPFLSGNYQMNLANCPAGVYMLKLVNTTETKIIKLVKTD